MQTGGGPAPVNAGRKIRRGPNPAKISRTHRIGYEKRKKVNIMTNEEWYLIAKCVNLSEKNAATDKEREFSRRMLDMQREKAANVLESLAKNLRKGLICTHEAFGFVSDLNKEERRAHREVWFNEKENA